MTDPAQQRADEIREARRQAGTLGRVVEALCGICPDSRDCEIPCSKRPTLGQSITEAFEATFGYRPRSTGQPCADEGPHVDEWVSPGDEELLQRRADDRTEGIFR